MKFYSQAVLMAAMAVPAFCQAPPAPAAPAPNTPPPAVVLPADLADQLAAADAQVKALADSGVLSADRVVQIQEKLANSDVFSADKMAQIQEKMAEAAEKMKSLDMDEIQAKAEAKFREAQDRLGAMPDLNFNLDDLKSRMNVDLDMKLQNKLSDLDLKLGDMKMDFSSLGDMAFLQEPKVLPDGWATNA